MIAACPSCGARYRIGGGRVPSQGARLRCAKCSANFRVTPSSKESAAPGAAGSPRLVLVADADPEAGKLTAGTLASWGLEPLLVHDGVEAILSIQRTLPRAVILDAGLPKMFGFQICELVKRNESLRDIRVVLVGAIHHRDRYRREPSEIYGADAYVERPQLPEALQPILRGFGLELGGAPAPPAPSAPLEPRVAPVPEPPPVSAPAALVDAAPSVEPAAPLEPTEVRAPVAEPEPPPAPPPPAPAVEPVRVPAAAGDGDSLASVIAGAERLARVIVSDVVLYNPEKFEAGLRDGNVVEALHTEMEEGRTHFMQRVDPRVRDQRDFLNEELLRVARSRSGA